MATKAKPTKPAIPAIMLEAAMKPLYRKQAKKNAAKHPKCKVCGQKRPASRIRPGMCARCSQLLEREMARGRYVQTASGPNRAARRAAGNSQAQRPPVSSLAVALAQKIAAATSRRAA